MLNGKSFQKTLVGHIYNRLKSDTPKFFKKVFYVMASLTTLGVSLLPYQDSLPESLRPAVGYLIAIGSIGAFMSRLTTTDPELSENK